MNVTRSVCLVGLWTRTDLGLSVERESIGEYRDTPSPIQFKYLKLSKYVSVPNIFRNLEIRYEKV